MSWFFFSVKFLWKTWGKTTIMISSFFPPCGRKSLTEVLVNKLPSQATLCPGAGCLPCLHYESWLISLHLKNKASTMPEQDSSQCYCLFSESSLSPHIPWTLNTSDASVTRVIPMYNSRHSIPGSDTRTFKEYLAESRLLKERPVKCKFPVSCWI